MPRAASLSVFLFSPEDKSVDRPATDVFFPFEGLPRVQASQRSADPLWTPSDVKESFPKPLGARGTPHYYGVGPPSQRKIFCVGDLLPMLLRSIDLFDSRSPYQFPPRTQTKPSLSGTSWTPSTRHLFSNLPIARGFSDCFGEQTSGQSSGRHGRFLLRAKVEFSFRSKDFYSPFF